MYLRFSIFQRFFFIKIPIFTPKITTFHGFDFGKQFLVKRLYRKLPNNNKIAMYKEETTMYLRFSSFKRFFIKIPPFTPKITTFHGFDFGIQFLVVRLYLKLLNNNKSAMYKKETTMYLRFSSF